MSGLIPQTFLDELLTKIDIIELIDSYVPLKKNGTSYTACCPFHHEKSPSFNVSAKKQFYHCFGCGTGGNAVSFVMQYSHVAFPEAIDLLAARVGLEVPRSNKEERKINLSLYQLLNKISLYYQQCLKNSHDKAIPYLKNRQLSGQTAKHYQIGYAPEGWHNLENHFQEHRQDLIDLGMIIQKDNTKTYDRYRNRIMFPIHDRNGRITGFGARVIDNTQKPKYLNSPETSIFHKSRELYGLYHALQQAPKPQYIIIVEGYMDVLALAEHGIYNSVATLGTACSIQHIQLLSKYTSKLYFCFDGDIAGRNAAFKAMETSLPQLNDGIELFFAFLPEEHDPDSFVKTYGADKFNDFLQQSTSFNELFFETLTKNINLSSLAGKSKFINNAKTYLTTMVDGIYKQLLIDEIARLTHLESHKIQELIAFKESNLHEKSIVKQNLNIKRTPLRLAIAILLQNPEIYYSANITIEHTLLDAPNQHILQTLIDNLNNNNNMNSASLIELWRNTDFFDIITKLATWDLQIPQDAQKKEFFDIILFLIKQNQDNKVLNLLKKSRKSGLTTQEKEELQELLKHKHKINAANKM